MLLNSYSFLGFDLQYRLQPVKMKTLEILKYACLGILLTAIEVIDDLENRRSASLNFLFRLSALEFVVLLLDKYLSQPRIILPYSCVSSRYDPSNA